MAVVSINRAGLDHDLLVRAGFTADALTKIQASGQKLTVKIVDEALSERRFVTSERIALKNLLVAKGLL